MNNKVDSIRKDGAKLVKNIGFVFADLNGLKRINDSDGHIAGDRLIKDATTILQVISSGAVELPLRAPSK